MDYVKRKYSRIFQQTFESASFMIQGCIGPNGGRLLKCDQRMNATCKASFLQENVPDCIPDIYLNLTKHFNIQNHNAALHRAELTQNFFEQEYIIQCPAQSSDRNILENVWLCIKNQLSNEAR